MVLQFEIVKGVDSDDTGNVSNDQIKYEKGAVVSHLFYTTDYLNMV